MPMRAALCRRGLSRPPQQLALPATLVVVPHLRSGPQLPSASASHWERAGAHRSICKPFTGQFDSSAKPGGCPCCSRQRSAQRLLQALGGQAEAAWTYRFAHFIQTYQPSPNGLSGRPAHCPFRGLLSVHSRCGLHTRAVTNCDTLIERLQRLHTSMTAPIASAWSGCRVGLHPLESAAFSRRTPGTDINNSVGRRSAWRKKSSGNF